MDLNSATRPRNSWPAWAVGAAVFLVYWATAAPGAWWGDGMELACAARTLGIPHPTGYPLYVMLGHLLFKLMPWIDPGRVLTLFSGLLLAAGCALLIPFFQRLIHEVARSADRSAGDETAELKSSGREEDQPSCGMARGANFLPAAGAALLIAFSSTLWEHATFAEVYPLTFFFGAVLLRLAWPAGGPQGFWRAGLIGGVAGLAALNHYSIVALFPLVAFCVIRWAARSPRPARMILLALGCFLIMLTGYLYLPLRARVNPPLNWSDPSTLQRLFYTLAGGQFHINMGLGDESSQGGLGRWLLWWGTQWLPSKYLSRPLAISLGASGLLLAIFGLARFALQRWELALGLLASLAATAGFAILYHVPDMDAYFLVALPGVMAGWIVAGQWLLRRLPAQKMVLLRGPVLAVLPAAAAMLVMVTHWGAVDKSWDDMPYEYGRKVMEIVPRDALVACCGSEDLFPLWYQQMALGRRPDVTVFATNWVFSPWYAKYFESAGRPKIPMRVEDRPLAKYKYLYDAYLFYHLFLPNLAQGRAVYAMYYDPVVKEYLNPRRVAVLIGPQYKKICSFDIISWDQFDSLYQLQPNPALAALTQKQLEKEFLDFYRRHYPPAKRGK